MLQLTAHKAVRVQNLIKLAFMCGVLPDEFSKTAQVLSSAEFDKRDMDAWSKKRNAEIAADDRKRYAAYLATKPQNQLSFEDYDKQQMDQYMTKIKKENLKAGDAAYAGHVYEETDKKPQREAEADYAAELAKRQAQTAPPAKSVGISGPAAPKPPMPKPVETPALPKTAP